LFISSIFLDGYAIPTAHQYREMLLDEAEKLYNKISKDFTNKTISDAAILSESSSPLSLLPQSDDDEKEQRSYAFQRSTGDANKTYVYREEHTFIQSEEFR
jgi:hypothetical protein